jgi:hypothetical protein
MYFKDNQIDREIELYQNLHPDMHFDLDDLNIDEKVLLLTSLSTGHNRYRKQVSIPFVHPEDKEKICERLGTIFSPKENIQIKCSIPFHDNDGRLLFHAIGILDVLKQNVVFELKFVNELKHDHFLQCASYMLAMNLDRGMLWNVKKNICYRIRIRDREQFLNQVAKTITKHAIDIAHEKDEIKKKVSVNTGLMGYIPTTFTKKKKTSTNKTKTVVENRIINKIAVIDIETNFDDDIVSLGIVIADAKRYKILEGKYYIFTPAVRVWGMYNDYLCLRHPYATMESTKEKIFEDINALLKKHDVLDLFAYNASFDYRHMPELKDYTWYDIMKVAAYKQHNPHLSSRLEYCATGRLKTNYGVEPMMHMLTASRLYRERHNAMYDAIDELKIMELLGLPIDTYKHAKIN